ncbi:deoxynucleotidyltransferase terminal-interacting protein 2 [Epinephelus moara]|uniref:deoxynucleotidyltransferase terminal-interacting protein 2 n=1 Tax=Epinephelus moara TaxID=300413 RepID=UPI00214E7CBF|nr:deoxynucleotidyltransferase terminal-interacting protein 2 [Epinephelus moara]
MVATRRGVRVYSPTKTNADQPSEVPATPSAGRRTRSTAKHADSPTHHALVEASSQLEKSKGGAPASPPPSSLKRCTRASRLHSPEQPCTPVGSTHEGDVSDVESCCSAVSNMELPITRSSRRRRQPRTVSQEDEEVSEVESCSSAVSATKGSQSSRRSTRKKTIPKSQEPAHVEAEDVKVDLVPETESCGSVVSESQRVTRSQRKTTRTRSSAKQQTEDSELSDAGSCLSSVSGATRSRRQTGPIPIHLDEVSEGSQSPTPRTRRTRAATGKAAATVDVSETPSCDSDGFESGPTYSRMTRQGRTQSTGPKAVDSDSELTDVHSPMGSPCSTRSKGTPCSSRTGSGSSARGTRTTRQSVRDCSIVLEKAEEDISLNDSRLESTVIAEDADCTLLDEDENQTLEEKEKEGVSSTDLTSNEADTVTVEKGVIVISEIDSPHGSPLVSGTPGCADEAVAEPAVTVKYQQEEPHAENKDGATSEMEMMQETIPPSEPLQPCQSVTVTVCESAPEITEETEEKDEVMEVDAVDTHSSQADEAVDEDAVVETGPSEEEKMEASTLHTDAQQVVDSAEVQVESIQVTSSQQPNISIDSAPEQQPKDIIIQKTKVISLLESSEDEDEDVEVSGEEEEEEEEEEEDLENQAEERAGPSQMCEPAAASVDGLFMIDTRPGQESDELYYKERPTEEEEKASKEQEEQDEEFVDEEGDDDDDEEAEILYSRRDPQSKELSSRIDPGIRVKELGGLYINFDGSKSKPVSSSLQKLKEKRIQDEVMKKSVMGPDFEKKDAVPPYSESKQALKLKHRAERAKSTGDGWFNMKAPEITQELKGDLQVLKMRGSMDPKRFYKKNDRDGFPKYFQVGTVVDSAVDFYHSRIPKKERKRTMVEELLSDAEFRQKNKKKFQHIVAEKAAQGAGKRNKKKNKFHKK